MPTTPIFISLHTLDAPKYYHPDTFTNQFSPGNIIYLGNSVTGGNPPFSDSYVIPNETDVQTAFNGVDPLSKLFFVESNSAHHITKFIVQRTYARLISQGKINAGKKILVVNFDQHEDFEGANGKLLCSNWGAHLCSETSEADYMAIGLSQNRRVIFWENCGTEVTRRTINEADTSLTGIYDKYDAIYVTVDMDVLVGENATRTNWRDGFMPLDELTALLNALPAGKIFAADITGFPPLQAKKSTIPFNDNILDSHITDITTVKSILSQKIV
ncbi:MAG: arginase family protein [Lachnospiraceae bacterium]|nr:arginase family protein [Lachnospiraceae bacterium]